MCRYWWPLLPVFCLAILSRTRHAAEAAWRCVHQTREDDYRACYFPDRRYRYCRNDRYEEGRSRCWQGNDLLPDILDACPDHRANRCECCATGAGMHIDPASLDPKAVANYAAKAHEQSITGFLSNIIPTTIVGAFADGDILQVLFSRSCSVSRWLWSATRASLSPIFFMF